MVALHRQQLDPHKISTVFVTHLHVDHFGGLPHLILDGQFNRRTIPLTVVGPSGTARRLAEAMEIMFPGSSTARRRFTVEVIEIEPGRAPTTIEGVSVESWLVNHGVQGGPFLSHRLSLAGKTIAYTGDTEWTDDLLDIAASTNLFIAEAYFWDKKVPYHLRHVDLLTHKDQLTSEHTILTHMSTDMLGHADEAAFDLARDGLTLAV